MHNLLPACDPVKKLDVALHTCPCGYHTLNVSHFLMSCPLLAALRLRRTNAIVPILDDNAINFPPDYFIGTRSFAFLLGKFNDIIPYLVRHSVEICVVNYVNLAPLVHKAFII